MKSAKKKNNRSDKNDKRQNAQKKAASFTAEKFLKDYGTGRRHANSDPPPHELRRPVEENVLDISAEWQNKPTRNEPKGMSRHCGVIWKEDMLFVAGGKGEKFGLSCLDVPSSIWQTNLDRAEPLKARWGHTMVAVGDAAHPTLILYGGWDYRYQCHYGVHLFDVASKTSCNFDDSDVDPSQDNTAREPPRRATHSALLIDKRQMLVFGGATAESRGRFTYLSDTWCLDTTTMTWEQWQVTGELPAARGQHSAVVWDNRMFVVGGCNSTWILNDVYCLDLTTKCWSRFDVVGTAPTASIYRVSAKLPACQRGCVLYRGLLFVYGGGPLNNVDTNRLFALCLSTGVWKRVPLAHPPQRRMFLMTSCYSDRALMFGGSHCTAIGDDQDFDRECDEDTSRSDTWTLDLEAIYTSFHSQTGSSADLSIEVSRASNEERCQPGTPEDGDTRSCSSAGSFYSDLSTTFPHVDSSPKSTAPASSRRRSRNAPERHSSSSVAISNSSFGVGSSGVSGITGRSSSSSSYPSTPSERFQPTPCRLTPPAFHKYQPDTPTTDPSSTTSVAESTFPVSVSSELSISSSSSTSTDCPSDAFLLGDPSESIKRPDYPLHHNNVVVGISGDTATSSERTPQDGDEAVRPPPAVLSQLAELTSRTTLCVYIKTTRLIGEGTYGKVYVGMHPATGQTVAVKKIDLGHVDPRDVTKVSKEISLLSRFSHPNIVRYEGFFTEPDFKHACIVMEYVSGGNLLDILRGYHPLDIALVQRFARDIVEGVGYLHRNRCRHRDVKPANILVDHDGTCKVADFGCSQQLTDMTGSTRSAQSGLQGTAVYMAPEMISNSASTRRSDIWSIGCTILELLTGQRPWSELRLSSIQLMFHIARPQVRPKQPDWLPSHARDFLDRCFERDPKCRADCDELLQHPFIKDVPLRTTLPVGFGGPIPAPSEPQLDDTEHDSATKSIK